MLRSARLMPLAACLLLTGTASAQEQPVRMGIGVDAAYTPMFLAKREKLFEKYGVNVAIQTYSNGGEGADASIAGVNDISGVAEPTAIIRMGAAICVGSESSASQANTSNLPFATESLIPSRSRPSVTPPATSPNTWRVS